MQLTLEVPDHLFVATAMSASELTLEAQRELALVLYGRGALSAGKAAELASMSRMAFEGLLAKRRIERPFAGEDFDHELQAGAESR